MSCPHAGGDTLPRRGACLLCLVGRGGATAPSRAYRCTWVATGLVNMQTILFLLCAMTLPGATPFAPLAAIRPRMSPGAAPALHRQRRRQRFTQPACCSVTEKPTATVAIKRSDYPAIFEKIEGSLEAVKKNPQAVLEAVVGIDRGVARYDRDGIMGYFQARPQLMIARAFDFLQAFRRIRAVWEDAPEGVDRGIVLRNELSKLGPVAVKVGQTLSQRPDILPEEVCEQLKGLQTSNEPFPNEEAYRVIAEDFNATGPIAPGLPLLEGYDANGPMLFKSLTKDCIASASLGQVYRGEMHDGREIAVKVQRPNALRYTCI